MKFIKINLAIVVLAGAIHYFWSGNNQFLPYALLAVAFSMLLTMYEEFSRNRKSWNGFFALTGFLIFGSYGIALLF